MKLDPQKTADEWYSNDEVYNWLHRQKSAFDDESRNVPPDTRSISFAKWLGNELRRAMAKGIQMANDRNEVK